MLLGGGSALAAEGQGDAEVAVGGGYDTNPDHALDGLAQPDGLIEGVGNGEGLVALGGVPLTLSGRYDIGARHYFTLDRDDVVAQSATAEASYRFDPATWVGINGRAKDRESRDGARDYRDFAAALFAQNRLRYVLLELDLGAERFAYLPDSDYSYGGPQATFTATVPFEKRHLVHASLSGTWELFDGEATDVEGTPTGPRRDGVLVASIGYTYRGPVRVTADYSFTEDASNSYGQTSQRHRLTASVAVLLPWHVVLSATGALQFTSFPQGVAVSPQILLLEDTENTDELALKLTRAWELGPVVELQGATYRSDFATNGLDFERTLLQATVGCTCAV